ncbi:STAS/SEC14 domain-containing protein [Oxalobacteraceae bacterium OM1]|nr:STAS/SEC14 domain-containing protein [Oxalobacteraceae bacterium OM1]
MSDKFHVELIEEIVVVRMRGEPTEALLADCHARLLDMVKRADRRKILYDFLEMTAPKLDLVLWQQQMVAAQHLGDSLQRAVVVPNTRLAYLARIAFGECKHQIFYDDVAAAMQWLGATRP